MKRLTFYDDFNQPCYRLGNIVYSNKIAVRLAAYEDTGMEPEEISIRRWIPVTERLPEDGVFVLVCNDDGHMMIAKHETETYDWYYKYTNYDFDIWDNEEQGPVQYWMPLPEPPEEVTP